MTINPTPTMTNKAFVALLLLVAAATSNHVTSTALSSSSPQSSSLTASVNNDLTRLFDILTTANEYIVGDLRTDIEYHMPRNLEVCTDAFQTAFNDDSSSPEYLTNPGPNPLPTLEDSNGNISYSYVQYNPESVYAQVMGTVVQRLDDIIEDLYNENFLPLLGGNKPMMMFDIDNTIAYTAYNDTDDLGSAPPIQESVGFVKKWCEGFGEDSEKAVFDCIFITARFCTELNVDATKTWIQTNFPTASDSLVEQNVMFSGGLSCSCCTQGNIAFKSLLRGGIEKERGSFFVASIGDQYTDSVGPFSGIKAKLPNFWFDSSIVPNQWTMGLRPPIDEQTGLIDPSAWSTNCTTQSQTPILPGPPSCIGQSQVEKALSVTSMSYCKAESVENGVSNQNFGCIVDITTGEKTCDGFW